MQLRPARIQRRARQAQRRRAAATVAQRQAVHESSVGVPLVPAIEPLTETN
jgi:hypothetical protein